MSETFTIRAKQNDTVDLICMRIFGTTGGITEQVMELNKFDDVFLDAGTPVILPASYTNNATAENETINLWS